MTGTELGLVTVMYSAQKGFIGGFAAFHIAVANLPFIAFARVRSRRISRARLELLAVDHAAIAEDVEKGREPAGCS